MVTKVERRFVASESVTEGHPDKVCDSISDAVLDAILTDDKRGRVACETFASLGLVIVGGEITTTTYVDLHSLVRKIVREIGYTESWLGFTADTVGVLNAIGRQSPDIAQGVNTGGAGDQGMMFGYAVAETPELMPMPIHYAHLLTKRLAEVRKSGLLPWLGPDGKSQVVVEYDNGKPIHIKTVVLGAQHSEEVLDSTDPSHISEDAKNKLKEHVIDAVIPKHLLSEKPNFYINQTGKFVVGGPVSDTGITGRKIIVDTYGGACPHGGGAFSGKDPTKVDRSASYITRYIAKNIVAAGLAHVCQVEISYVIGRAEPTHFAVRTFGTGKVESEKIAGAVQELVDLRPAGIIEHLDLLRPIYSLTTNYGHFGRELPEFTWEDTSKLSVKLAEKLL
ncbi:MAG TPA: methionine adenosyltransferase [Caldisericia bacterium]|nr:methionine adenosyltransferase [Caldisericia bacterium]HPQ92930.1 methionine adenosyltransferase [Caldisericia bacterium]